MRPELLSPAGSPEALQAAVQCGANAVYLGWGDFNARRGAKNFSDQEFADALTYCHLRGVRVFLTLNTLVTDRELPRAVELARTACRLGVDAVLVQDWGLLFLLRSALPDLPIHASTQMSVFTSGGAEILAREGCERVVLARECSGEESAAIARSCPAEIEVFAHGALCMCYSGQCEFSALIGGRSGNRGRCAQPCRMPYGFNQPPKDTYPLSLKDNCLAAYLPEMALDNLACVKLEGRMKRPEYVAVVTRIYARLLAENRGPTKKELQELEQAFSRSGFTDGYWLGRRGPDMFGTRPADAPEPEALFAQARAAYEKDDRRLVPVTMTCRIQAGVPCTLAAADNDGHNVTVSGPVPEEAKNRPLAQEEVAQRLSKTGGTAFTCPDPQVELEEGLRLSASSLNALRRQALEELSAARCAVPPRRELPLPQLPQPVDTPAAPAFTVSVTSLAQLQEGLADLAPARIYAPLEELADLSALPAPGCWYAILPRVWKDRDEPALKEMLRRVQTLGVQGALIGNIGQLSLVEGMGLTLCGDYGLNVFNAASLAFLRQMGLQSACLSFALRFAQIRDMAKLLPTEAIVYGHLPVMITENCLVQNHTGCRRDLPGSPIPSDAPCRHPNALWDRTGSRFPLLPAYGHRTEIQNSRPLWLADRPEFLRLGLHFARLRFTTESPRQCREIYEAYLSGQSPTGEFTRGLYERGVE